MTYTIRELAALMNIAQSEDLFLEIFVIEPYKYVYRFANQKRPLMVYHLMDLRPDFPDGAISIWHGEIEDIPDEWYLCDGTNSTPDLRDSFIPGAGGIYAVGAAGGGLTHNHPFTGDGHSHGMLGGPHITSDPGYDDTTSTESITGTTNSKSNLPRYTAYAFMMFNAN